MSAELHLLALSLLLKLTFVFVLVLGILYGMRRLEPRWRVLLCRIAFVGVPAVILGSLVSPGISLPLLPDTQAKEIRDEAGVSSALFPDPQSKTHFIREGASEIIRFSEGRELSREAPPSPEFPWVSILAVIWISGVAMCLVVELVQWMKIRKIVRDTIPANETLQHWWNETAASFGVPKEKVTLRSSQFSQSSPFLFPGRVLQLIIPARFDELLTESEVKDVFRHEASHAATQDSYWLMVARLLNSLLWFHPLLRWVSMEHLVACEEAADAAAARIGNASGYRQALAHAALKLRPVSAGVPSLIRRSRILNRLRKIELNSALRPPTRRAALSLLFVLLAVCVLFGNVSLAQKNEQSPKTEPVVETASEKVDPFTLTSDEQKQVDKADELALRADQLWEQGHLKEALAQLTHSLNILPDSPLTEARRNSYLNLLHRINLLLKNDEESAIQGGTSGGGFDPKILKTLIIPQISFESLPLKAALKQLETLSAESDPTGSGVSIRLQIDKNQLEIPITLKLSHVPLAEALRFTTSLASLNYQVNDRGVIVFDPNAVDSTSDLFTAVYSVSESFFPRGVDAKELLERIGIQFATGASAVFNSESSTIVMRNTGTENEKLELLIDVVSATPDPNELWYRGFLHIEAAEGFENKGESQKAARKLAFALPLFRYLRIHFPDYQKEIVQERIQLCEEKIIELQFGIPPEDSSTDGESTAPELRPNRNDLAGSGSSPTPPELADSVLKISGVTVDQSNDRKNASLEVEIISHYPSEVSAEKMSLEVKIFDLHHGKELAPGTGNITIKYPTTPYDWKAGQSEQVQITYEISPDDPAAVHKAYYGYVIELYHDEILQYVVASPSKLVRLTP